MARAGFSFIYFLPRFLSSNLNSTWFVTYAILNAVELPYLYSRKQKKFINFKQLDS